MAIYNQYSKEMDLNEDQQERIDKTEAQKKDIGFFGNIASNAALNTRIDFNAGIGIMTGQNDDIAKSREYVEGYESGNPEFSSEINYQVEKQNLENMNRYVSNRNQRLTEDKLNVEQREGESPVSSFLGGVVSGITSSFVAPTSAIENIASSGLALGATAIGGPVAGAAVYMATAVTSAVDNTLIEKEVYKAMQRNPDDVTYTSNILTSIAFKATMTGIAAGVSKAFKNGKVTDATAKDKVNKKVEEAFKETDEEKLKREKMLKNEKVEVELSDEVLAKKREEYDKEYEAYLLKEFGEYDKEVKNDIEPEVEKVIKKIDEEMNSKVKEEIKVKKKEIKETEIKVVKTKEEIVNIENEKNKIKKENEQLEKELKELEKEEIKIDEKTLKKEVDKKDSKKKKRMTNAEKSALKKKDEKTAKEAKALLKKKEKKVKELEAKKELEIKVEEKRLKKEEELKEAEAKEVKAKKELKEKQDKEVDDFFKKQKKEAEIKEKAKEEKLIKNKEKFESEKENLKRELSTEVEKKATLKTRENELTELGKDKKKEIKDLKDNIKSSEEKVVLLEKKKIPEAKEIINSLQEKFKEGKNDKEIKLFNKTKEKLADLVEEKKVTKNNIKIKKEELKTAGYRLEKIKKQYKEALGKTKTQENKIKSLKENINNFKPDPDYKFVPEKVVVPKVVEKPKGPLKWKTAEYVKGEMGYRYFPNRNITEKQAMAFMNSTASLDMKIKSNSDLVLRDVVRLMSIEKANFNKFMLGIYEDVKISFDREVIDKLPEYMTDSRSEMEIIQYLLFDKMLENPAFLYDIKSIWLDNFGIDKSFDNISAETKANMLFGLGNVDVRKNTLHEYVDEGESVRITLLKQSEKDALAVPELERQQKATNDKAAKAEQSRLDKIKKELEDKIEMENSIVKEGFEQDVKNKKPETKKKALINNVLTDALNDKKLDYINHLRMVQLKKTHPWEFITTKANREKKKLKQRDTKILHLAIRKDFDPINVYDPSDKTKVIEKSIMDISKKEFEEYYGKSQNNEYTRRKLANIFAMPEFDYLDREVYGKWTEERIGRVLNFGDTETAEYRVVNVFNEYAGEGNKRKMFIEVESDGKTDFHYTDDLSDENKSAFFASENEFQENIESKTKSHHTPNKDDQLVDDIEAINKKIMDQDRIEMDNMGVKLETPTSEQLKLKNQEKTIIDLKNHFISRGVLKMNMYNLNLNELQSAAKAIQKLDFHKQQEKLTEIEAGWADKTIHRKVKGFNKKLGGLYEKATIEEMRLKKIIEKNKNSKNKKNVKKEYDMLEKIKALKNSYFLLADKTKNPEYVKEMHNKARFDLINYELETKYDPEVAANNGMIEMFVAAYDDKEYRAAIKEFLTDQGFKFDKRRKNQNEIRDIYEHLNEFLEVTVGDISEEGMKKFEDFNGKYKKITDLVKSIEFC